MKNHLLALFKFSICLSRRCDQNLHSFVIVLHDLPIKIEETELYMITKKWRSIKNV